MDARLYNRRLSASILSKSGGMTGKKPETRYETSLTSDEIEVLTRWHERAYSSLLRRRPGVVHFLGRELEVPAQVFPPTPVSDLLGNAIISEVRSTDRVLDMGTGSGVNAILAASVAREVVGVDVNPFAVEAACKNAERNGVAANTIFFESDVFDAVEGPFDLIIFDPPFRWLRPRDMLERSIADEEYRALIRFMREARQYLTASGRILLFFGSSGDLVFLRRLMELNAFTAEVIGSRDVQRGATTVNYFTYRLT